MPELSLHNIDQISRDLRKQDITFSHLLEELIDHVCCDVEYEMQNGLDFSTFLPVFIDLIIDENWEIPSCF